MARGRTAADAYAFESESEPEDESVAIKSSFLYAMLPRVVKSRFRSGKLPSLRRSLSGYGKIYTAQTASTHSRESSTGGIPSPPPEYQSRASLSEPVSDAEEAESYVRGWTGRRKAALRDKGSGIRWKFANQGLSLIGLSAQESTIPPEDVTSGSSSSLARQLYIHGLTYILRGLPGDLSADEKISIWTAVPDPIHELSAGRGEAQELLVGGGSSQGSGSPQDPPPSHLHRLLAAIIVQFCIIASFLGPYIRVFLGTVYRYERQHRVSERVFASSVTTVDWSVKKGVEISGSVAKMNDGKVGQAMNDLAVWWIKGVTGGIHQGVGEGMVVMGMDDWDGKKGKEVKKR